MKPILEELAELQALNRDGLIVRYRELFGKEPRCKQRSRLFREVAWKLQEARLGGLSAVARRRLNELTEGFDLFSPGSGKVVHLSKRDDRLFLGSALVREWRGKEIRVKVLEDGFELEGQLFKSLTAVAKAVTGQHRNGRAFFGLMNQRSAESDDG